VLHLPCLSVRTSVYKDFNATQTRLMKTKLNFGNSTKIGRRFSVLIKLSRNTHFSLITTRICVSARISGVIGASFAEKFLQQTFLFFRKILWRIKMKCKFSILPFSFVFRDSSTKVAFMECHFIIQGKMA
jgi:hypothetical protein